MMLPAVIPPTATAESLVRLCGILVLVSVDGARPVEVLVGRVDDDEFPASDRDLDAGTEFGEEEVLIEGEGLADWETVRERREEVVEIAEVGGLDAVVNDDDLLIGGGGGGSVTEESSTVYMA